MTAIETDENKVIQTDKKRKTKEKNHISQDNTVAISTGLCLP